MKKTRKLLKADIRYIDPLNCGSTVGYNIIDGRSGIYADLDFTDCNRKVNWGFSIRGQNPLAKIDAAIGMLIEFRSELDTALRRRKVRRKKRA